MNRLKIPKRDFLVHHLRKHSQYNQSEGWVQWYADVAVRKGLRTVKMLKEYKGTNARVLDVGCGIGITLSFIAQAFPDSVGCDIDKDAIRAARKILKEVGIKIPLVMYGGKTLPFEDDSFDIITSIEVIEHVEDPNLMLREMRRVLKPNGILHITTANKWWPYEPHFKLFLLSYLPQGLANLYVRFSGRGESYEGIKLPRYSKFKALVSKYFIVDDITLPMIKNYKKYAFDKERGIKVVIVGNFLFWLEKLEAIPGFRKLSYTAKWILTKASLGWLFIGRPRNTITFER